MAKVQKPLEPVGTITVDNPDLNQVTDNSSPYWS